jgi:hypothetical protein
MKEPMAVVTEVIVTSRQTLVIASSMHSDAESSSPLVRPDGLRTA